MMALLWKGYDNAMPQNTKRDVPNHQREDLLPEKIY